MEISGDALCRVALIFTELLLYYTDAQTFYLTFFLFTVKYVRKLTKKAGIGMEEKHIGKEIIILSNGIKRKMQQMAESMGITGTQSRVLQYICEEGRHKEVFQRDIEEAFQIRRPTVTQIIQLMERNGLIVRESVERDARLKRLILTEKAYKIEQVMEGQMLDMENKLSRNISSEEKEMLLQILNKIRNNLT